MLFAAADMLRSILTFLLAPLATAQAFEVVRNGTSTGSAAGSCSMPAATRGSDRFYEVEARNVDGRVGERQTLLGLFPIHKQVCGFQRRLRTILNMLVNSMKCSRPTFWMEYTVVRYWGRENGRAMMAFSLSRPVVAKKIKT